MVVRTSLFIFLLFASPWTYAKQIHVAFVGPALGSNPFWDSMIMPLQEVAEQLDVRITFHTADFDDRFDYFPKTQELLSSDQKPDYLISGFRGASAKPLLELVEQYQVPLVSISSGVPLKEIDKIGYPQQHYKYWLAQILADDESSGFLQAQLLREKAKSNPILSQKKALRMAAIGGGLVLETSIQKDKGLLRAIDTYEDLEFLQLVHADWNTGIAARMTHGLFERYSTIDLIWNANDDMAIAAAKAVTIANKSRTPVLVAGIDWTQRGLLAIEKGELAFSLGGNHMQAVWALILIHDIAHGYNDLGFKNNSYRIPFLVADKTNVKRIRSYVEKDGFKSANYKQFSKHYNKQLKSYDFDLMKLIDAHQE